MKFYAVTYEMATAPDGYASHFFSSKKEATSFRSSLIKEEWEEAKEIGTNYSLDRIREDIRLREVLIPTDKKGLLQLLNSNHGQV